MTTRRGRRIINNTVAIIHSRTASQIKIEKIVSEFYWIKLKSQYATDRSIELIGNLEG